MGKTGRLPPYLRLPEAASVQEVPAGTAEPEEYPAPMEEKFCTPPEENFYTPIEEKFQYNNTRNNNTSMNILSFNHPEGKKEETDGQNPSSADVNKGEVCPELDLSGLKLNEKLRSGTDVASGRRR